MKPAAWVAAAFVSMATIVVVAIVVRGPTPSRLRSTAVEISADEVARGAYLARAGNCSACHTAPDGQPFAGGLKMATPLGVIETTNITPDPETGIGAYRLQDFDRALRQGVARDGHYLYPAMPYPSYAKISDADVRSLYVYFRTEVLPVKRANVPSAIPWPLNLRWPLALWNAAFAPTEPYREIPGASPEWNRGAYLVQGLGHCGACHTPRGLAEQERAYSEAGEPFLAGAPLDHWSSPDLGGDPQSGLGPWSVEDIAGYLKTGHNRLSSSFGTMTEVINSSTQHLSDVDVTDMAIYLKTLRPSKSPPAIESTAAKINSGASGPVSRVGPVGPAGPAGAASYWQYCGSCHGAHGEGQGDEIAPLAGNPAVEDKDPTSIINIVLNGSMPIVVGGLPDRYKMPPFRNVLDDAALADLLQFVRHRWGNAASPVRPSQVATLRAETDFVRDEAQLLRMQ
jgi:mono/diheme cytochrome c family protein